MPERAAEYVRMSTEHQRFSTENQSDVIRQFAARRNIEILAEFQRIVDVKTAAA